MLKVFISWSGEVSRQVALVLHDWLPHVIQFIKPFISSDVSKGMRWTNVLAQELNDTDFGIICVTSGNFKKPWLNFEAGALSKSIGQGQVTPFLFRVESNKIEGPLSQFQFTRYDKNDMFYLLTTMCKRLNPENQLDPKLLREEFDHWWGPLTEKLNAIKDEDTPDDITGYNWLYPSDWLTPDWLTKMQTNSESSSIWIIARTYEHLCEYSLGTIVNHAVYRYILSKEDFQKITTEYLGKLQDNFDDLNETFIPIDEQELIMQAPTDFIIINPNKNDMKIFYKLPIKSGKFWAFVEDENAASGFYERFEKMFSKRDVGQATDHNG